MNIGRAILLDCYFTSCFFVSANHPHVHMRLAYSIFPLWWILFVQGVEPKAFSGTAKLKVALDFSIFRVSTSANASLKVLLSDGLALDNSLILDGSLFVVLAVVAVTGDLALLGGLAFGGALGLGGSLLSGSLDGRGVGRCNSAIGGGGGRVELEELLLGDAQHLTSGGGGLGTGEARELFVVDL